MAQHERLHKIKRLLDSGRCVARSELLKTLEVSPATLKRDIAYLRDRMNYPLQWDRDGAGWRRKTPTQQPGAQFELPGLWLDAQESHALLTMQHLLTHLDSAGLLRSHIEPLANRLTQMLGAGITTAQEVARRIHVQTVGARKIQLPHFQAVASAVLRRKRLQMNYHGRGRNLTQEREVSPQRLIHYRDNWYLDAWCHKARGLRSFAVDAVQAASVLNRAAINVAESELDAVLGAGYGIFAGRRVTWARLRFSAERARWVAAETWHAKQRGHFEDDGRYVLELPYADPRELIMDILRHVPEVEVLRPAGLQEMLEEKLRLGLARVTL